MVRKRASEPEVFLAVKTDASCASVRTGRLLAEYLFDELSPAERAKFEQHLGDCIACSAAVVTARSLRAAIRAEKSGSGLDTGPVR
jgi:anti-sigma factor RsiW